MPGEKAKKIARLWLACLFAFAAGVAEAPRLWAAQPIEQVKANVDDLLEILRDPRLQIHARKKEKQERLKQVIGRAFDFVEMAKQSLGSHWHRNAASRAEVTPYLSELVTAAYIEHLDFYKGKKIAYLRARAEDGFADVDARILTGRGSGVPVVYKLHFVDGDWKIYDLAIDNMSWVNFYRSQWHRILAISSFDTLLKLLQEKRFRRDGSLGLKTASEESVGDRMRDSETGVLAQNSREKILRFTVFLLGQGGRLVASPH